MPAARTFLPVRPAWLAVVAALLPCASAVAEPPTEQIVITGHADDDGYRSTRSSALTKTDTPLKEVPASLSIVPAALMRDQAMQSLADVIRFVPGASVHQGEGNRDQFILRGVSTTADLYVDGIRDDAQIFRDLYNLERVEVLKGTAGMIFGRGGAGGVVNRVTKKPLFVDSAAGSITLDSRQQRRATVDVGRRAGDAAAWRVNAMAEASDSFRQGVELQRQAVNPTLRLTAPAGTIVTASFEHLHDTRTADRGVPSRSGRPVETEPGRYFGNAAQSRARSTVDGAALLLEHDFGALHLTNQLRVTHYDKFYRNVYPDNAAASSVDAAAMFKLAAYDNANRRTNVFNQTDVTARLVLVGLQHTLLAGAEFGRQASHNQRHTGFFGATANQLLATVSVDSPFAEATAFRANGSDADSRVRADIAAVYLQDQLAFSPQWKLLAGVRHDRFTTRLDDRRTTTTPTDLQRTDTALSPRVGLIWQPDAGGAYYTSISRSFLPSGEQLSLAPNTADLAPETAVNAEIGARWDLLPKLQLSAALFRLDRNDVRAPDPATPGFFIKTGQQRTEGVELGLQGEPLPGWQLFAGYARLAGRITRGTSAAAAGARLQLVPRNALSVWNRIELPAQFAVGLGLLAQGASYAALDNRVRLPGWARADAALFYSAAEGRATLALNVENLFDRRYFATADGNNNISPGAPRGVRLTLSGRF